MFNLYSLQKQTQVRHAELIREAEHERLLQQIKPKRSSPWSRLTWKVGDKMILLIKKLGEKIYVSQQLWSISRRLRSH